MAGSVQESEAIYQFKAVDIDGNEVSMDKYRGKVTVVVNVACKCGLTKSNYEQMQPLYVKYQEKGFEIAAFPSNDFMGQEPWPEQEIKQWTKDNFGVTFDMYSKVAVNGGSTHPLFAFLKEKQPGTFGKNGVPINRYSPKTEPKEFEKDIRAALGLPAE